MADDLADLAPDTAFYETVVRYLDGQLSREELPAFEAQLAADAASRRILLDICLQMALVAESPKECLLSLFEQNTKGSDANDNGGMTNRERGLGTSVPSGAIIAPLMTNNQFPMFNEQSSLAPIPPSSCIVHPSPAIHYPLLATHSILFSYLVASLILGVGMLIGWAWKLPNAPQVVRQAVPLPSPHSSPLSIVGRITGMVDCQWSGGLPSPACGRGAGGEGSLQRQSPVHLHDRFALASGLLEITYDSGAKVILQGPCTYEVESRASGYLSLGKLTASVEKKEGVRKDQEGRLSTEYEVRNRTADHSVLRTPYSVLPAGPSPLFTIKTPTALVTDLGTEFGVEVDKLGNTSSHVFRGSVWVQLAAGNGEQDDAGRVLHENESARVEQNDGKHAIMLSASTKSTDFVRKLVKPTMKMLDLVDVVAGGNGFSSRRNAGINPSTGLVAGRLPQSDGEYNLVGDYLYHKVTELPLVDGVFIPDGTNGQVQIDSAGHTFEYFAATANMTTGYVWANGAGSPTQFRPVLDGVDYASPEHGALLMHANKGITFDLEAIRRANHGCKLLRFLAVVGNAEASSQQGSSVYADVWVFIDGRTCVQRRQINAGNGAFPIAISLADGDRYLTLAATDGGNSTNADWIVFGDPRIELRQEQTAPAQDAVGHGTNTSVSEDLRPR